MKKTSYFLFLFILTLFIYTDDIILLEKKLINASGRDKGIILVKLIEEYLDIDIVKADKYSNQAAKFIHLINDPVLKIDINISIATVHNYKNRPKKCFQYANNAYIISKKCKNKNKISESLVAYGRALIALDKNNKALEYFKRALLINQKTKNFLLKGRINLSIGLIYDDRGEFIKAEKFYQIALSIFKSIKNKKYEASALNFIGNVYNSRNEYSIALDYLIKSLKYYEKSKYKQNLASLLNDMGVLSGNLGNDRRSLEFYLKAKSIIEKESDKSLNSTLLNNIGIVYHNMGDLDKSLKYYFEALKSERKKKSKLGIAIDLYNIGTIYFEKYQLKKAEEYIIRSKKISLEIEDRPGVVMSLIVLSQIYKQKNRFKKALGFLHEANKESERIDSKELKRSIYEEYSYLYTGIRNYKLVRSYYNKSEKLRKEILNDQSSMRIAETRTKFEMEKKELEIENLKHNQNIQDLKLKKKEMQKNIILIGVLILVFVIILIYRQFRLKAHSNNLIRSKNDELKRAYKKLENIAAKDPLTKLSNRRDILKKISFELKRFKRYGRVFTLIIGDIDDFKTINDNYGHDAGDYLLVSISSIFEDNVRKQDTVGRWGGEEFLVFLPETNLSGGIVLAEKIRKSIGKKIFNYQGNAFNINITFGVSEFREGMEISQCIKNADMALYRGKKEGKNQIQSFKNKVDI